MDLHDTGASWQNDHRVRPTRGHPDMTPAGRLYSKAGGHQVIRSVITPNALERILHSGGVDAEASSGDGAGSCRAP